MIIFNLLRRYPIIPAFIYTVLIITAVFAPLISPQDPYKNSLRDRNVPPLGIEGSKSEYILGTDPIGRDMLSRLIYGARVSAMVMFFSILIGVTIGTTLGLISGYFGGHIDEIIMRFVDIWAALPFIMIALVVVLIYGQSFKILVALLALMSWPGPVRLVRAQTLSLKNMDYIASAKIYGASNIRILAKHLLPGTWNIVLVAATLNIGSIILTEATLSFLGVGIPPPTPAWGAMTASGRNYLNDAWWVAFMPGMCIFLVVVAGNFIGDWLRDRLDPSLRQLN
ncbi:MAG: peptide ABC transporter permease [Chloroflexi bacterium]|nr:peptide ABC transporter permease [Chloroflexota bacterium]